MRRASDTSWSSVRDKQTSDTRTAAPSLHDGNGIRVTIVNAFTTVKPETEATVRAVDYLVVGAAPEQFRVYADDERDVARWRRVETPESPWTPDPAG